VNNLITPPVVTSSTTTTAGTIIYLIFDQIMIDPAGEEANFSIYSRMGTKLQVTKSDLYPSNTKVIRLTLSNAVIKADSISVTYKLGNVRSSVGIPAETFTSVVTNTSTTDVNELANNALRVYPSPFKDQINLVNVAEFDAVAVLDMSGKTLMKLSLNGSTNVILSGGKLKTGAYLLVLSKGATKTCRMVMKK
jgi:hypothetical protein